LKNYSPEPTNKTLLDVTQFSKTIFCFNSNMLLPFNNFLKLLLKHWRMKMSTDVQEKDNFWLWVGGAVLAVVVTVVVIKSSEHEKFETSAKAIAEDPANSAYRK
jgi:hypothetical protein